MYDHISEVYQCYTRQNLEIAERLQTAARRVVNFAHDHKTLSSPLHLDFGCGSGHVLGWLKDFGFLQIGLDISLVNLRNARKNTGCLVVCGNACNMPFMDGSMDLITESSVLHHILAWKQAIYESIRVCHRPGGVTIDSEPSRKQVAWSRLALAVFNARFPIYRVLSLFWRSKYVFRNIEKAKLNLQAEVHHQPGTGFPLDELSEIFTRQGFTVDMVLSPTPQLKSLTRPKLKKCPFESFVCPESMETPLWAFYFDRILLCGRLIEPGQGSMCFIFLSC